jgi:hypothetical protein
MAFGYDVSEQVHDIRSAPKMDGTDRTVDVEMSEAFEVFERAANGHEKYELAADFVSQLVGTHRTLQQGIIRLLAQIMTTYWVVSDRDSGHKHSTGFDARNDAAVTLCKELAKVIDGHHLPVI